MSLRESVHVYPHPILKRAGLSVEEIRRCRTAVEGPESMEAKVRRMNLERAEAERCERYGRSHFFPPMKR
jgi:hypothetical protein